jgi:hypothetical protein
MSFSGFLPKSTAKVAITSSASKPGISIISIHIFPIISSIEDNCTFKLSGILSLVAL